MFNPVDINSFIVDVDDEGWFKLDLNYFANHPEIICKAKDRIKAGKVASGVIRRRYRTLNNDSRSVNQSPKKGVAVRKPSLSYYSEWLNLIIRKFYEHYGDILDATPDGLHTSDDVDRYVAANHEFFQMRKMGLFAPYKRNSLTKSVSTFIAEARVNNEVNLEKDVAHLWLQAIRKFSEEDLSNIPDGSIHCVNAVDAVYGANVQGLACGLVQLARDKKPSTDLCSQIRDVYGVRFSSKLTTADNLVVSYKQDKLDFDASMNLYTNLKRVQVGGLDFGDVKYPTQVTSKNYKDAKYRTINSNDPFCQVAESSAAIAWRDAVVRSGSYHWRNTLLDPDLRWRSIEESLLYAYNHGIVTFPCDFELHDARLHAECMFNLMQHGFKPKFREADRNIIDLASITLVFKLIMAPSLSSNIKIEPLIGALGSGHPFTGDLGSAGTRTVSHYLAACDPSIFCCPRMAGFNNGDDTGVPIYKTAIQNYGIEKIIELANSYCNKVHYYFNESKFLIIELPGGDYVTHWEQYAYWVNPYNQRVRRHGSALRYFGKVYSDEDLGRQGALEGLLDQFSTLNNTIGYVGDETFHTTTFTLDLLAEFVERDDILKSYIAKHGKAFFKQLTKDAVKQQVEKLSRHPDNVHLSKQELEKMAQLKVLQHLRASGYDKSDLGRIIHNEDFSFLSIVKLIGLGPDVLKRIAGQGLGKDVYYKTQDDDVIWLD